MMDDKAITEKHFTSVVKTLIIKMVKIQLEMATLQKVLSESGVLSEERVRQVREQVALEAKAVLDSLAEPTLEKLEAMLRGFEGPVQ